MSDIELVKISDQMRDMLIEFARYQGALPNTFSPSLIDYQIDRFLEWYSVQLNERLGTQSKDSEDVEE